MTDIDKRIDELKQRFYDAFNNNARLCDFVLLMDAQEALILELQAQVVERDRVIGEYKKRDSLIEEARNRTIKQINKAEE